MDDRFGWSVALSADGSTLAVGAFIEDRAATGVGGNQSNDLAESSGVVYVFTRSGTTRSQQAYVKASNAGMGDSSQTGGVPVRPRWRTPAGHDPQRQAQVPVRS